MTANQQKDSVINKLEIRLKEYSSNVNMIKVLEDQLLSSTDNNVQLEDKILEIGKKHQSFVYQKRLEKDGLKEEISSSTQKCAKLCQTVSKLKVENFKLVNSLKHEKRRFEVEQKNLSKIFREAEIKFTETFKEVQTSLDQLERKSLSECQKLKEIIRVSERILYEFTFCRNCFVISRRVRHAKKYSLFQ